MTPALDTPIYDLIEYTAGNKAITDSIGMTYAILQRYRRPLCSISGGADSDIMLDLCARLDVERKMRYIWFNTGLEYQATRRHLDYLEERYHIRIERACACRSIPACCKEYGLPFVNKIVSKYIEKLQLSGFKWENLPYEILREKYPNNYAVEWWCNKRTSKKWNIEHNKYLKEFLVYNPPSFKISDKCCYYSKKKTAAKYYRIIGADLSIIGVRKSEGGARSLAIKHCYSEDKGVFRPLFWYKDEDKKIYDRLFNIKHSECYSKWGFKRTGCVGCPFNRHVFDELQAAGEHEPGLYAAALAVFGESYEYTRKYREYVSACKSGDKTLKLIP